VSDERVAVESDGRHASVQRRESALDRWVAIVWCAVGSGSSLTAASFVPNHTPPGIKVAISALPLSGARPLRDCPGFGQSLQACA